MNLPSFHKQQGFLLIAAIILVAIFGLVAVIISRVITDELQASSEQVAASEAFEIANAGLQVGLYAVTAANISHRVACTSLSTSYSNVNFGSGQYSLTGTQYKPTAAITLTNSVTSSSTVLPVNSLSGLAPYGQVMVDQELILYRGTSNNSAVCGTAPCLIDLKRGNNGSTATSHNAGAAVGQDQCLITATAGVPNLANPTAKRTLTSNAMHLEEGWAVGDTSAGGEVIGYWNGSSWTRQAESSVIPNKKLNSLSAISYADIWAVGASADMTYIHYNGSAWAQGNVQTIGGTAVPNVHYNDVYCAASNDCWAVGEKHGSDVSIAHWDGTIWTKSSAFPPSLNVTLKSVTCASANDCWTVGSSKTFLHWDGTAWSAGNVESSGSYAVPSVTLYGVTCTASNNCWAVGASGNFIHWNGTIWQKNLTPSLPTATVYGIDCTSSNNCWAVGQNSTYAFLAYWDGSVWQREASGNLVNVSNVDYYGVQCSSSNSCWASGNSGQLIHYNGTTWDGGISNDLPSTPINDVVIIASQQPQTIGLWQQQ